MPYRKTYTKRVTYARKPVYRKKYVKKTALVAVKKRKYNKNVSRAPTKAFVAKVFAATARVNTWNSDVATKVVGSANGQTVVFQGTATLDNPTHISILGRLNNDQVGDSITTKGYYLEKVTNRSEVANISEFRIKLRSYLCVARRDLDFAATQLYGLGFTNNSSLNGTELSATPYQSTDFVQSFKIIATKNQHIAPGASKFFVNSQKHMDMSKANTILNQCTTMKGAMVWLHLMEGALGMDSVLVAPTTIIPGCIIRNSVTAYYREMADNKPNLFKDNQLAQGTNLTRYINEELNQVDTDGNTKA